MNTKTLPAAIAALTATITLAACGGSSVGAPGDTTPEPMVTTVRSTRLAPRDIALVSTTTTLSSTSVAPRQTAQDPATTTASSTTITRPTTVVDEFVPVNGGRLHLHCDGAGPTTVVLIAGFSAGIDSWAAIEPTVAQTTRACLRPFR